MAGECKQQRCESNCQVWHLAVGGESNPTHLHMPCLPGGGRPGGGLQFRTYEGGCRSACSGSVRHPVQHLYPAGRMRKWLLDTKEWFWDGMFVMKTENPTNSASHYCLPFPRPTMRLPRICNSRLVEVHHIHPPPAGDMELDQSRTKPPQNPGRSPLPPQTPLQEGSKGQSEAENGVSQTDSHSESETSKEGRECGKPSMANETCDAEKRTMPNSSKAMRVSHVKVTIGSPPPANAGDNQSPTELRYGQGFAVVKGVAKAHLGVFHVSQHNADFGFEGELHFASLVWQAHVCACPPHALHCPFASGIWLMVDQRSIKQISHLVRIPNLLQNLPIRAPVQNLDVVASTAVDVKELANCYIFLADMPGMKYSDVKVQVENDTVLKISGKQMQDDFVIEEEIKYILVERNNGGRFVRKFSLPNNTNVDGISAACQDGLLTVIVPKSPQPEPLRPRSFDVDVHSVSASPRQATPNSPPNPQ